MACLVASKWAHEVTSGMQEVTFGIWVAQSGPKREREIGFVSTRINFCWWGAKGTSMK